MNDKVKDILSWVLVLAAGVAIGLILRNKVLLIASIPSGSMEETIMTGDIVMGNRLSYLNKSPERGDIVMFYAPDEPDTLYIKRIIGLPGETITISDAKIYVNDSDKPLYEDYLPEDWVWANDGYVFEVPEGCYLMLGDNRNGSLDARLWTNTYVTEDAIQAKAICILFPFGHIAKLNNYEYAEY